MITDKVSVYITKRSAQTAAGPPREDSMIGKRLLYYGLRELSGKSWQDEPIKTAENGKPFLLNHRDVHFNISHSEQYVICAIAPWPLGIDIQYHKPVDLMRMAARTLSDEEYRQFLQTPQKQNFFFQRWVEKESFLKWTGAGLRCDMRTLEMTGYSQHIEVERDYSCALWMAQPAEMEIKKIAIDSLMQDKGI